MVGFCLKLLHMFPFIADEEPGPHYLKDKDLKTPLCDISLDSSNMIVETDLDCM